MGQNEVSWALRCYVTGWWSYSDACMPYLSRKGKNDSLKMFQRLWAAILPLYLTVQAHSSCFIFSFGRSECSTQCLVDRALLRAVGRGAVPRALWVWFCLSGGLEKKALNQRGLFSSLEIWWNLPCWVLDLLWTHHLFPSFLIPLSVHNLSALTG